MNLQKIKLGSKRKLNIRTIKPVSYTHLGFSMVGYLSSEVREAQDRVRTALRNSGYRLQAKKITVNLSPADIRKEGTAYDLSIAVAVLGSYGIISTELFKDAVMIGELGLDGTVKPVDVYKRQFIMNWKGFIFDEEHRQTCERRTWLWLF